mmetsp:Transcript_25296/g.75949  ORF Transcript_25296/g.75949 Transcript_25296/m.75949 type:complete len:83 (-) Transcript_25296:594-842(-)
MGIDDLKEHEILYVSLDSFVPLVQEVSSELRKGGDAALVDQEAEKSKAATPEEHVNSESPAVQPKAAQELEAEVVSMCEAFV